MRTQRLATVFVGLAGLTFMLFSCSKVENETTATTLKAALSESSQNLNSAVIDISKTDAYQLFTLSSTSLNSSSVSRSIAYSEQGDSTYSVYIPLDKIKGTYEYKPVSYRDRLGRSLIKFFNKTGDDDHMIVKMPLSKVKNPRILRSYRPADSTLTNNFTIEVSDYYNNYNNYFDYDYKLVSEITIDNAKAGDLSIQSFVSPSLGADYNSQYSFENGYTAAYSYKSGDTTESSFSIKKSDKVLYEEKRLTIKNDTARFGREHQYVLIIGDVKIVRSSETHKVDIYVNGILQPNATVSIIDNDNDSEASVCKKREIQITFEDGTTTTISALIGATIEDIKTLFTSLHQVYFAAYVVDWIAYDIYYNR